MRKITSYRITVPSPRATAFVVDYAPYDEVIDARLTRSSGASSLFLVIVHDDAPDNTPESTKFLVAADGQQVEDGLGFVRPIPVTSDAGTMDGHYLFMTMDEDDEE